MLKGGNHMYDEKIKETLILIWDNYESLSHKTLAQLFATCYDNAIRASEHDKFAETEQSFKDTFTKLVRISHPLTLGALKRAKLKKKFQKLNNSPHIRRHKNAKT